MDISTLKQMAGETAVTMAISSGMVIGLGTGSTAVHAVRKIGQLWQAGQLENIVGIPTSEETAREAAQWGIPLSTLADHPVVDVTIDGADEIDPRLNLIKGLGGALLREKIVATASQRMIVVADERKQVDRLGTRSPVPVEVIPFAEAPVTRFLQGLGAKVALRMVDERPYITDEQNILLDCTFSGGIADPAQLNWELLLCPGVVEHGLFLNIATDVVLATANGIKSYTR